MRSIFKSLATLVVIAVVLTSEVHSQPNDSHHEIGAKAVVVIKKRRTESLNGYLLIVCKASGWKSLEKDSDLGPFLRHKKPANNLDAIVAMPENPKDGSTYGIYFQDHKPIGFVEIKTGKGEKINPENVAKAYISITEASDPGTANQIRFQPGEAYTDDDKPIPTLKVVSDGDGAVADFRSGAIKSAHGLLLLGGAVTTTNDESTTQQLLLQTRTAL